MYARIPLRKRNNMTVARAIQEGEWPRDIGQNLDADTLREYINLWHQVAVIQLDPATPDRLRWAWENKGEFSVRSAYAAKFMGREIIPTAEFTWRSRAPLQCRFFAWLALRNRCWTSDRLARRGLPHQDSCPLCSQGEETISHLLVGCVFSRMVWHEVCQALGMQGWTPTMDSNLNEWCETKDSGDGRRKDYRAIFALVFWELWKHRNGIVFDGASPSLHRLGKRILEEGRAWKQAGLLKGDLESFFQALARWVGQE